jgi:hypothetical protein
VYDARAQSVPQGFASIFEPNQSRGQKCLYKPPVRHPSIFSHSSSPLFSSYHHHSFIYTRSSHCSVSSCIHLLSQNLIMRQALIVIGAFALGNAVSAAPAARPYEDPYTNTPVSYYSEPSTYPTYPVSGIFLISKHSNVRSRILLL